MVTIVDRMVEGEKKRKANNRRKISIKVSHYSESSACECHEAIAAISLSRFSFVVDSKLARGGGGKATQRMIRECVGRNEGLVGDQ